MNKKQFLLVVLLSVAFVSFAGGEDAQGMIDLVLVDEAKKFMKDYETTYGFNNKNNLHLEVGFVAEYLQRKGASMPQAKAYIESLFVNIGCEFNRDMVRASLNSAGFLVLVKTR